MLLDPSSIMRERKSCASETVEPSITDADAVIFLMIEASFVIIVKTNLFMSQSVSLQTHIYASHISLSTHTLWNLLPYQHRFKTNH